MNAVLIENLTKTFDENRVVAIDNLSLEIKKGKITGIIGADGAGKTTLLRIIVGLLKADSGEIATLDFDPKTQKEKLNSIIGYMPQKFGLYEDLTVIQNLNLYADLKNVEHDFAKLLDFTKLKKFQNRLAGALSGGMKQKLGLACSLLGSPKLLVLDEPSVGVDPISRQDLMQMVKDLIQTDTSVIYSTAYLDEAFSFDEAIVIDKGKVIFQGDPKELAKDVGEFEEKIIELMGGFIPFESKIAQGYEYCENCAKDIVEALDLNKKYGDFYAVKKNTFSIKKGEIFGLLGPNGAGKSTSFKMMCGLSHPSSGSAKIMGIDITKDPSGARAQLGYMAQKFSLYSNLSVKENLEFFAGVYGVKDIKKRVDEIIEIFNLEEYSNKETSSLPLGLKQKLSLATALIHKPQVLFLDEPTSGVDVIARREFWQHIRALAEKGVSILITTHFMDEAEFCDRISLFYKGEAIAIGTVEELKLKVNTKTMQETFVALIEEFDKNE